MAAGDGRLTVPTEISVGPPVLTINHGSTFIAAALDGSISADSQMGLLAGDTRVVSHWRVSPEGVLYIDSLLPEWLPDVCLRGLRVGESSVDLHVWRDDGRTRWDAKVGHGALDVQQRAWKPW